MSKIIRIIVAVAIMLGIGAASAETATAAPRPASSSSCVVKIIPFEDGSWRPGSAYVDGVRTGTWSVEIAGWPAVLDNVDCSMIIRGEHAARGARCVAYADVFEDGSWRPTIMVRDGIAYAWSPERYGMAPHVGSTPCVIAGAR